jgi:hypothetical protein
MNAVDVSIIRRKMTFDERCLALSVCSNGAEREKENHRVSTERGRNSLTSIDEFVLLLTIAVIMLTVCDADEKEDMNSINKTEECWASERDPRQQRDRERRRKREREREPPREKKKKENNKKICATHRREMGRREK